MSRIVPVSRALALLAASAILASCSGIGGATPSVGASISSQTKDLAVQSAGKKAETPEITVAPASLTFTAGGVPQTVVATTGDDRTISATSSDTACATVSPGSAHPSKVKKTGDGSDADRLSSDEDHRGNGIEKATFAATFTVTAAGAGECAISLTTNDKDGGVMVAVHVGAPPKLYVMNAGGNSLSIYDEPVTNSSSAGVTLTSGLSNPVGAAFDSAGNLYVANYTNSVTVYTSPFGNSSAPSVTITNGIGGPQDAAFDSAGNLYVSNNDSNTLSIYNPPFSNSSAPSVTLTGTNGLFLPQDIAFDANGNLYVANRGGNVTVYHQPITNASAPSVTISNGVHGARGLAFDASGNLYVANCGACSGGADGVTVYNPPFSNASVPVATITSGLNEIYGLAFDGAGKLYVANAGANSVTVYNPPFSNSSTAVVTVSSGMNAPVGVLVH